MDKIEKTDQNFTAWLASKALMCNNSDLESPFEEQITKKDLVELVLCNKQISNQCLYQENLNGNLRAKLLKNILDDKELTLKYINTCFASKQEYKVLLYHIINNNDIEFFNSFNQYIIRKFLDKRFIEELKFSKSMAEKYDAFLITRKLME